MVNFDVLCDALKPKAPAKAKSCQLASVPEEAPCRDSAPWCGNDKFGATSEAALGVRSCVGQLFRSFKERSLDSSWQKWDEHIYAASSARRRREQKSEQKLADAKVPVTQQRLEDRRVVESFSSLLLEACGKHCLTAVALPWSSGSPPAGILCPASKEAKLDAVQLGRAAQDKRIILISCSFKYATERAAVSELIKQIRGVLGGICVIAVQPAPAGNGSSVNPAFSGMAVDDVLVGAELDKKQLRSSVKAAYHKWSAKKAIALNQQKSTSDELAHIESLRPPGLKIF